MFQLTAYNELPFFEQTLHGVHFMICAFAMLIACVPLFTEKGSIEHKFSGLIYLPVSFAALFLASYMAWREASVVLFCFNSFCAYLLLSGWRAVHEKATPRLIDWIIPGGLMLLAAGAMSYALVQDNGRNSLYLFFFAFNAFYLSWRDFQNLRRRAQWQKHKVFFGAFGMPQAADWLNRHVAGMVGSLMANMSVVVLTLLPLSLHWIWPAALIVLAGGIALQQHRKKRQVRKMMAAVLLRPKTRTGTARHETDEDYRRAA